MKNILKRVASMMMMIVMLVTGMDWSFLTTASAETSVGNMEVTDTPDEILSMGEWLYFVEDGKAIVAGYVNKEVTSLKIPGSLGGNPVAGIGHKAFVQNNKLENIQIHTNITRIAEDAFDGLTLFVDAYNGAYALQYAAAKNIPSRNLSTAATFVNGVVDLTGLSSAKAYSGLSDEGVTFAANEATFLREDQILYFPAQAGYPTGLAKTVAGLSYAEGKVHVTFSQPEWGEVFLRVQGEDELYVDWAKAEWGEGFTPQEDVSAEGSFTGARYAVKVGADLDLKVFHVIGSYEFALAKPTVKWDIGTGYFGIVPYPKIKTIDVKLPFEKKEEISVSFKATGKKENTRLIPRQQIYGKKCSLATVPVASAGGVVNGYLTLEMVFEISAEAKLSSTVLTTYHFTFQNGKIKGDKTQSENHTFSISGSAKVGPELKLYFVLGWAGFSIRFFEASIGIFVVAEGSLKWTKVTGPIDTVGCQEISSKITLDVSVKLGLIDIGGKTTIAGIDITFYKEFSKSYDLWNFGKLHWENGCLVEAAKDIGTLVFKVQLQAGKCSLTQRSVSFNPKNGDDATVTKNDVNTTISVPKTPEKKGYKFEGWYVDTEKSGLSGDDYAFNFKTMKMPYLLDNGTLYMYAKWKDMYPVTSIKLNKTSITGLSNVGATEKLSTASILPTNANNKKVKWSTSNAKVATVDEKGNVKLKNAGTAVISCTSVGNPSVKATCNVTVKQSVTGIKLNKTSIFRYSDDLSGVQLTPTVLPDNAANKAVTWKSNNTAVAEVSSTGYVTLKGLGTATITCSSVSNPNVVGTCSVAVRQAVTGITLNQESHLRTNADMSPLQLKATVAPSNAWNKSLKWESSNPAVATVTADGLVKMVGLGKATITCRSVSNPKIYDTFDLTIIQAVTEIGLNEKAVTRYSDYKDPIALTPTVLPANAGNKSVTWETSDPSVVKVTDQGVVTVVGAGSATIICRSVSNPNVVGECKFTILQAVTGITLNKTNIKTTSDEINVSYLLADVAPANAYNKAVTWETSDAAVADVSRDGVVTIKGVGNATITCRSVSTPYITAECSVQVVQAVTDMKLSENSVYRYSNEKDNFQLVATLTADEQANIQVDWTSSDSSVATVSDSGIVTVHGVGEAVITAASVSNPDVKASCKVIVRQSVESIALDKTELTYFSDEIGSVQLEAAVLPGDAANPQLKWVSSNEAVATVTDTGLVTLAGPGTATITCTSISDPDVSATCSVTVYQEVSSLSLNLQNVTRYTNETGTIQLTAFIQPSYAYNKEVTWQSSNEKAATVSEEGVVTIQGAGEAVITCTSVSNPAAWDQCSITIRQAVDSIALNRQELNLLSDAEDVQLTADVQPATAENPDVVWESSDPSVVIVSDSGLVSIAGCGEAVITCTAVSNPDATDSCYVTVKQAVLSVNLDETEIVSYKDEEAPRLTANVQPVYAQEQAVVWESSNEKVVTVSEDGELTFTGIGEAVVTVTSVSNPAASARCTVLVKQPMTGITLNQSQVSLYADDEGLQLTNAILPANTEDTEIIWESSNINAAIVSDNGFVQPVGQGTAVISCRSARNPETVYADCEVTVLQAVEEIWVEGDTDSLLPGETLQLSTLIFPDYADDTDIIWSSDDETIATVDEEGCVTAVNYGSVLITANAGDGRGALATYRVHVDHELVLKPNVQNESVYAQGDTDVVLAHVSVSGASARRLEEKALKPVWTLVKPDDKDDVHLEEMDITVSDRGQNYDTVGVMLVGSAFGAAGSRTYTVRCDAGSYSEQTDIIIAVDGTQYAEKVMLSPSTITLDMGETYLLPAVPVSGDDNAVPDGIHLEIVNGDSFFSECGTVAESEEGTTVSFGQSGVYTAVLQYAAGNLEYETNITFFVLDENGIIRIRAEEIQLDQNHLQLVQGDVCTLHAAVTPLDAFDPSVTWSSTDENVVTVDQEGRVTAVAPGKAAVVVQANDGSGTSAMCAVNVEQFLQLDDEKLEYTVYTGGGQNADIGIVNVTMDSERRLHENGLNVTWKLEKISGNATQVGVEEFRAEAEESITVSGNRIRLLRMNGEGTDEYRLICKAGDYTAECRITFHVVDKALPESLQLVQTEYTGKVNEKILVDTAYAGDALPEETAVDIRGGRAFENALSEEYDFVEREKLIFRAAGTYTAEVVFSGSNYSYTCPITIVVQDEDGNVPVNITGIEVEPEYLYMQVGDAAVLTAAVQPADASHGKMTWRSSDTSIATVSESGIVTALGAGMVSVTVSVPESDFLGSCLVIVEDGLTLQSDYVERTVFVDGITRTRLDVVQLTAASSSQLDEAPQWKLERISGNNLTLRVQDYTTFDVTDGFIYGCAIQLYSMSREGTAEYELTCIAGDEQVTIPVTVHAVKRSANLPSGLNFAQTEFAANVNELMIIEPEILCLPAEAKLPDGMRVELVGGSLFNGAQNWDDFCVSQNRTSLSFNRAGLFEANFEYTYANMRYVVPVTFRIKDDNGYVPVLSAEMKLSSRSLWLLEGEETDLNAVFTPADADNRAVTWRSSDETVVKVDANGHVKAVGKGSAYIICTPADPLLTAQSCGVWVEDYLMLETAEDTITLYKQGRQENEVFSALLSEGTIQRLKKENIKPEWKVERISGNHSEVAVTVSPEGDALIVTSVLLKSGGSDVYRVTCTAGDETNTCEFTVKVVERTGVPQSITLASKQVKTSVGKTLTLDFTPVCQPGGTALPKDDAMWDLYAGLGQEFQDAMDWNVYAEDGNKVTVKFTKPGRYLLSRQFFLENLHYEQVCEIIVGQAAESYHLLKAGLTEAVVYMGGKAGTVTDITLDDSMVYDLYGRDVDWSLKCISGSSLNAVLKEGENGVILYAVNARSEGEDVWRITCSFGAFSESVDIRVRVEKPRSAVPDTVNLVQNTLNGMTGDWLNLPVAVECAPAGSALPETGDDFWSFEPQGIAEDVCSWSMEDGMLRVMFYWPGYYTGILHYEAGNFRYDLPVYMRITDEEGVLDVPAMAIHPVNVASKVYMEGAGNTVIGTAQLSRSLNAYYAGEAAAYLGVWGAEWNIEVTSGKAAALSLRENDGNSVLIVLEEAREAGRVGYKITCTVNGSVYSMTGILDVMSASEIRPDAIFRQSIFYVKPGEMLIIPTNLYERGSGNILQSETEWNPQTLMPVIGHEFTQTNDSLQVTFYEEGIYHTKVTAKIGNLVYDVPLTVVVGNAPESEYTVMKLPSMLEVIEEEAFAGSPFQIVDLRGTKVNTIEPLAFSNCDELLLVYIPDTVTNIEKDVFEGSPNVTIVCEPGSAADTYAARQQIAVRYE